MGIAYTDRTFVRTEIIPMSNAKTDKDAAASNDAERPRGGVRDDVLDAVLDVFVRRGYEGATLTQLAGATQLSKASLYHHFPGGKAEMAEMLLQRSVQALSRQAFRHLTRDRLKPAEKLARFVAGFDAYCDAGEHHCLVAVLAQGSLGAEQGDRIHQQYQLWCEQLTSVFEELGEKPKAARRNANELIAQLYGALLLAQLTGRASAYRQAMKRLLKAHVTE